MGNYRDSIKKMLDSPWKVTVHDMEVVAEALGVGRRERGHQVFKRESRRPVPIPRPKQGRKEVDRVYVKQFLELIWDLIPWDLIQPEDGGKHG
ncbi:MAG TPA: hypothetical protein VGL40_06980 [Bacillota bacterium]|jgi:hypothetical protein